MHLVTDARVGEKHVKFINSNYLRVDIVRVEALGDQEVKDDRGCEDDVVLVPLSGIQVVLDADTIVVGRIETFVLLCGLRGEMLDDGGVGLDGVTDSVHADLAVYV